MDKRYILCNLAANQSCLCVLPICGGALRYPAMWRHNASRVIEVNGAVGGWRKSVLLIGSSGSRSGGEELYIHKFLVAQELAQQRTA